MNNPKGKHLAAPNFLCGLKLSVSLLPLTLSPRAKRKIVTLTSGVRRGEHLPPVDGCSLWALGTWLSTQPGDLQCQRKTGSSNPACHPTPALCCGFPRSPGLCTQSHPCQNTTAHTPRIKQANSGFFCFRMRRLSSAQIKIFDLCLMLTQPSTARHIKDPM